jgi:2-polyprenyl-3-methyl-5-hydroxy-6-metoxy-1,4-benzoquinol methylase
MTNPLLELCKINHYDTDKYCYHNPLAHAYVETVYHKYFASRRESVQNVLEVGIGCGGGSLLMWRDYFPQAQITGLDITYCDLVATQPRICQMICDAYDPSVTSALRDQYYDVIIDDGPHTLESMKQFLIQYPAKLKPQGIMVIEDIPDLAWGPELYALVPDEFKPRAVLLDLRARNHRFDDIMLVIDLAGA